ncbi:hypothetical protein GQR99_15405 [Cereibacter sphaeroides]|nr:hypothetical protein APX01_14750 [Cereibacter sphaeroides]ANS35460.1 hypothetical protein A3858_14775 [Cereibacter sphaeroides]ATN64513.1 hypothetical protein A3857_14770 [Cereibacter sphaeroides]QHA11586.1 hypothetical protein GQR99_15405 [Cereibacter sphaeroides]
MQAPLPRQALRSKQMPGFRPRMATPLRLPMQGTETRLPSLPRTRRLAEAERLELAPLPG